MKKHKIASWASWKRHIGKLLSEEAEQSTKEVYVPNLLFRGHNCASWKLKSTLARKGIDMPSVNIFSIQIQKVKLAFESYLGCSWHSDYSFSEAPSPPENYEFMVYLRHHGYPTPLLDWTRSPYIATFFAFQNPSQEKFVGIYSFKDKVGEGKSGWTGESNMVRCGPTIKTHKRHYSQQSEYTYCRRNEKGNWYYSSHEQALESNGFEQDIVCKYLLPSCIRKEVLAELDAMNINAYTLYGSEEGLAEMLCNREYEYKF